MPPAPSHTTRVSPLLRTSSPNQGLQFANGSLLYLPISEQPLDWDQRHTLSASLVIRDPSKWGVNLLWTFGSGLLYTPTFRNDRKPDPAFDNSRSAAL